MKLIIIYIINGIVLGLLSGLLEINLLYRIIIFFILCLIWAGGYVTRHIEVKESVKKFKKDIDNVFKKVNK